MTESKSRLIRRGVTQEEIQKFCAINSLEYIEVSAKDRMNVTSVFVTGAKKVIERINCGTIDPYEEVSLKARN